MDTPVVVNKSRKDLAFLFKGVGAEIGVKVGGIVSGHDYNDVKSVVDSYPNLVVYNRDKSPSWMWYKI